MDNKLIVRSYIKKVLNTGNVADIENYVATDYKEIHEGIRHKMGISGAREHISFSL